MRINKLISFMEDLSSEEIEYLKGLIECREHGQSLALEDTSEAREDDIPRWTEIPKDEPPFSKQVIIGYLEIWNRDKHKIGL